MRLNVKKIRFGGISTTNKVTPCVVCDRFTDDSTSPLIDVELTMESPRGATSHTTRLPIHYGCFINRVPQEHRRLTASDLERS